MWTVCKFQLKVITGHGCQQPGQRPKNRDCLGEIGALGNYELLISFFVDDCMLLQKGLSLAQDRSFGTELHGVHVLYVINIVSSNSAYVGHLS